MGLIDALSGALTVATNGAGNQQQKKLRGRHLAEALAIRLAQLEKEKAETAKALAKARRDGGNGEAIH